MGGDPSNVRAAQPPLHIHRPIPRRTLERSDSADSPTHDFTQSTPPSATENRRTNDFVAQLNARLLRTYHSSRNDDSEEQERGLPPRNQSLLNLTSSTLSGIYDESGDQSSTETPWGTGAETPKHTFAGSQARATGVGSPDGGVSLYNRARKGSAMYPPDARKRSHSIKQPRQGTWKYLVIAGKLAALYVFGVMYGVIVSHIHETKQLAAIHVEGVDQKGHAYLATWGLFGVALGSLLPYVDLLWNTQSSESEEIQPGGKEAEEHDPPISEQVNDVVRSVAAFIGIAFAIVSILSPKICFFGNPPSPFQKLIQNLPAPPPVAIDPPTYPHARSRKPRFVVHTRPLETRTLRLAYRNIHTHLAHLSLRPQCPAFSVSTGIRECHSPAIHDEESTSKRGVKHWSAHGTDTVLWHDEL